MRIITISREFGSGGRELGKRLADVLGFDYYDKEILAKISEETGLQEEFIEKSLDGGMWQTVPMIFARSFVSVGQLPMSAEIMGVQTKIIQEIAKRGRDFIIIGRCADVVLSDYKPLNLFVYADKEAKLVRCKERATADEQLTDAEILKKMKKIDSERAKTRSVIADGKWGEKENYHLMVNTSGEDIKSLAQAVGTFAAVHFDNKSR